MARILSITCFASLFLLLSSAMASDQNQKAEVAKEKAETLEEKASSEGSKTPPAPKELITKPQVQAVDPTGDEPG